MLSWWRRWRSRWAARFRQQVTRVGMAYAATMLLVAAAAFISANNLLFLILAAMLSTFMISGFISRMGLAGLELDISLPQHTSARRRVRAMIRLKNDKPWIPSFSIHLQGAAESGFDSILYFPVIPSGAVVEEGVEVCFQQRGRHRERSFQFSTRFPFGFTERHERITIRHDVLVYPCLDPQPGFEALLASVSGEMEAMQRGRGSDFYRIRPYEVLESARHVDWKATAHTGELQVREFAREQDRSVVIYLDLDVPFGSDAWFERCVECVAFLAYELAGRDARVRLVTQEFDITTPEGGDIYTILKYLALVSPMRGKPSVGPDDTTSYQVVFTANEKRTAELGWGAQKGMGGVVLGPANWSAGPANGISAPGAESSRGSPQA
jgi:uncharacterized protein (DUF58 family)